MNPVSILSNQLDALLWGRPTSELPHWHAGLVWFGRLLYALIRDLAQGNLSLHATSLVYTTLLSLVPLLAVSFSVLKGFGVHNELEPLLLKALEPLGNSGVEVTARIIGFVDNMSVGVLGSVGLAMLLFTVVSLIQKIEQVFNDTWRVTNSRRFSQRFSQYLSILLIGPVLFFSAVGLSASLGRYLDTQPLMASHPIGLLAETGRQLGPYAMISLTFTFVYMFVPNTRVHLSSAVIGALVAGLLWELIGGMFAAFMAGSTRFMAIYSSLAILMLLMIWIHIGWLILLIGTSVAFYHQHPEYLTTRSADLRLSNRQRERLALWVAGQIARDYQAGKTPWTSQSLSHALGVPSINTERTLTMLEQTGFLIRTADEDPGFVPARAPETIPILDILIATRCFEERDSGCRGETPNGVLGSIEQSIESATATVMKGMTLGDFGARLADESRQSLTAPASADGSDVGEDLGLGQT